MNIKDVNNSYIKSVVKTAIDMLVAFGVAKLLLCSVADKETILILVKIFGTLGLLLGASAIGQLGWEIQTWNGTSDAEKRNTQLFRIMYYFAIFFTALSLYLS
ncbi:MAG: hypothetical protein JSS64_01935 [Bacteroidetes bacterium]|nr:hypothetical protein [Bacteroidota bacterium]